MLIKIKTSLTEYNYSNVEHVTNIIGNIDDNIITYIDDAVAVTILKYDDYIILKRATNDYIIELNFKTLSGGITLLESNKTLPLEIKLEYSKIADNKINIKYILNTNPNIMHFKLEYEVDYES